MHFVGMRLKYIQEIRFMNTCHFLYSNADVDDDEKQDEDEVDSVTGDYNDDDEMCLNKFDSIKYTFENELK